MPFLGTFSKKKTISDFADALQSGLQNYLSDLKDPVAIEVKIQLYMF